MSRSAGLEPRARPRLEVWSTDASSHRGTAESLDTLDRWDVHTVRCEPGEGPTRTAGDSSAVVLDLYAPTDVTRASMLPTSEDWRAAHASSIAVLVQSCFALAEDVRRESSLGSVVVMTPHAATASGRIVMTAMARAMESMVGQLALEWRPFGVRVNVVRFDCAAAGDDERVAQGVVNSLSFLASDASRPLTGETLRPVDHG